MLKLISLMKRKDGMTKEEFIQWATVDHAPFAREIPGMRKYVVNVTEAEDAPFDAANEMWFDDEDVLYNPRLRKSYAVVDGVPVLLIDDAVTLGESEHERLMTKAETDKVRATGPASG